jgi:prepilin-type N-terminal cleavage/methylation domain-containing protein
MRSGFTLIELLVVIAIIAILSVVVILVLNPSQLLQQARDSNRLSDLGIMNTALGTYAAQSGGGSTGAANTVYLSIPDPTATTTAGDQCQGLGLPALPESWTYQCAATSTYRNVNNTGWIPINFSGLSAGSPLGQLPQDVTNSTSTNLYYVYTTTGSQWELTDELEATKSQTTMQTDGGVYDGLYQLGNDLNLTPPFRSSELVGYWPLTEGTGTLAYDYSGKSGNAIWSGTKASPSSTHYESGGKVGGMSGYFDGSTNAVTANDPNIPTGANSFTKSVWIYLPAGVTSSIYADDILGWGISGVNNESNMERIGGTTNQLINYFWANDLSWISADIVNGWNNIVVTYDGTTEKGYVNGAFESSYSPATPSVPLTNVVIGGKIYVGDGDFSGQIDDVRVYNRALSSAEISALYNAEK